MHQGITKRNPDGTIANVVRDSDWLFSKVQPVPESGCWIWDGYVAPDGYGRIRLTDKNMLAHRYAYQIANGSVPNLLMHKCDNKCCVNPDHLTPGDHRLNAIDHVDRQGGNDGMFKAVLSEETREQIKEASGTNRSIAQMFGISPSTVNRIKNGKDKHRNRR